MPRKNETDAAAAGVDDLRKAVTEVTEKLLAQLKAGTEKGAGQGQTRLLFPNGIDLIHVVVETTVATIDVKVAGPDSAKRAEQED